VLPNAETNNASGTIDKPLMVEAYSRLHFGLLEIHPHAPHCYGGIGLMIDKPSVRLSMSPSGPENQESESSGYTPTMQWSDDYWKQRFDKVYRRFRSRKVCKAPVGTVKLELAPIAHIGLGSGTQFACAASAILNTAMVQRPKIVNRNDRQSPQKEIEEIIGDSGRGLRSHIGLRGFFDGQLIVDQGQFPDGDSSGEGRTHVQSFPDQWRVVILYEDDYQGDSGHQEQSIFDACAKHENPNRSRMMELIDQQILPCLGSQDYQGACQAIGRYGELAGEIFAPALGDSYRSPRIRSWIDRFRSWGFHGAGQSSWGPVVFVIAQDDQQAQWLLEKIRQDLRECCSTDAYRAVGPGKIQWSDSSCAG
jgi:beta-ribofuranosylaminobenzene 5'-phosphate synthase